MKKLLSLFCAIAFLSGCSSFGSNGGLFGGSECESREARDFMANAEDRVFFAFDSSALSDNAVEVLNTQVKWLKDHKKVNVIVQGYCDVPANTTWLWVSVVPMPLSSIWYPRALQQTESL